MIDVQFFHYLSRPYTITHFKYTDDYLMIREQIIAQIRA